MPSDFVIPGPAPSLLVAARSAAVAVPPGTARAPFTPPRDGDVDDVDDDLGDEPSDRAFMALQAAYRGMGGIARARDLARQLHERQHSDVVSLTRLILAGEVFSFGWLDTFWVPMFQFDPTDLSRRPDVGQVLAELVAEFDGWRLAGRFVRPNGRLNDGRPIDLLEADLAAVLGAARRDRFVAR
ncbi:MAG: hypothetical protein ABI574_10990 [Burkholderiales bacterium]